MEAFPLHVQDAVGQELNLLGQRTSQLALELHRALCTVRYDGNTLKRAKPVFVVGYGGVNIEKAHLAAVSTHSGPRYNEASESWMDPRTD